MKAALLAILFVSLLPSILAAAGGWRFAHGASALGEVTVATNVSNATASVKPGDFLPPAGYFEAETGAIEITLTGGNLKDPFVTTFVPPSGYSTLVAAGTAPSLKTFSDSISTAQKLIGGSVLSAVRLINGVNNSVTLKFNGTGYSDFVVASTDGFLDASDYQTVPSRDVEGTFFIVDAQDNMLAEAAGTLDVEAVYTAFFSESTDTDGTHLKLKLAEDQPTLTVSYVRAVHAVPDLKNKVDVDVVYSVLANATVAANISYFTVSDFVATQPGNNEVLLRVHGGNESSVDFPFANFANYTVLVFGFANSSQIEVIPDTLTTSNNSALVRIINVIPGTPVTTASIQDSSNTSKTVSLNTTTPAADAAIYLAVTGASTVKAQIVSGKSASPVDYTFNKNTVYTVWIYGTPTKPQIEVTQDYPTPPTANGLSNLELGLIIAGAIMFVILLLAIIIFAVRSRPAEGYERIEN